MTMDSYYWRMTKRKRMEKMMRVMARTKTMRMMESPYYQFNNN
jgi:hypothetical protein